MASRELIEELAGRLEVTPEQLAADIHRVCAWIQEQGNRGYSGLQMRDAGLPVYMLEADKALYDGMLFFAEPSRRGDYSGWGVKRQPMIHGEIYAWETNWLNAFQHLEIELVGLVKAKIDDARNPVIKEGDWVEYQGESWRVGRVANGSYYLEDFSRNVTFAKRDELTKLEAPRRKRETFSGGHFSSYTTFDIAYRAACCVVLSQWHRRMYQHHMLDTKRNYSHQEAVVVWQQEYAVLLDELRFRSHAAAPSSESSKKKAAAIALDWAKAKAYAENPVSHFFSYEFAQAVTESPEYPDLSIDPDHLPKQVPEKTPIKWQTDRQVMDAVLRWLDKDIEPSTFEYEDREKFIDVARRWIATARGEGVR